MSSSLKIKKTVLSAMFLALALVLPFLTGQIREIGNALCPMHLPVILCGFLCGPISGCLVGFIAPLLRCAVFGMPPLMPIGVSMCFELAAYGLFTGLLYKNLPQSKTNVYISLITAMIAGRIVWGLVRAFLFGVAEYEFGWKMFIAGAFLNAIPGIIIQLVLIPILVIALNRYTKNAA